MALALRLRALSSLLATIILIAIVLSAGLVVYGMLSGWMGAYSSMLSVQPTSVDLVVAGDKALLSVSVKNTGSLSSSRFPQPTLDRQAETRW